MSPPPWPEPRVVYHRAYNYGVWGTQWLHPFDQRKFARIWRMLLRNLGNTVRRRRIRVERPVSEAGLLRVHSRPYLDSLRDSRVVARAMEIPLLAKFPAWLVERLVLRPMRWQTMGTLVAGREALAGGGLVINLGGGFHHARRELGHGFNVYNDIAVTIDSLRSDGRLKDHERVACIDLDAHHGDGVASIFADDPRVFLLDLYNEMAFPLSPQTRSRVDCNLPLLAGCDGAEYLNLLRRALPGFLGSLSRGGTLKLVIYNAGTDVYERDPIGQLGLSEEHIAQRDLFVLEQLAVRRIPTVMLLSGGYTPESYRLVADSVLTFWRQRNGG